MIQSGHRAPAAQISDGAHSSCAASQDQLPRRVARIGALYGRRKRGPHGARHQYFSNRLSGSNYCDGLRCLGHVQESFVTYVRCPRVERTWQLRRECVRAGKPSPRDLELDVSQCRFSCAGTNKICSSDLRRDKAMYTLSRIGFYAPLSSWLLPLLYRGMVVSPNLIFRNSVKRFSGRPMN